MARIVARGHGGRRRRASRRTHSPTHFDSADRPVPSRLSQPRRAQGARAEAAGRGRRRLARLPARARPSAASRPTTRSCSSSCRSPSRMPVIIQGLGARSKVDAPTAGWDNAKRFVDEATAQGAAVYSMAMSKPFNRTFDLAAGTKLYEGALAVQPHLHRGRHRRPSGSRCIADPAFRDADPRLGRQPEPRPRRRARRCRRRTGPCCTSTRSPSRRTRSSSAARSSTSPPSGACTPPTPCSTSPLSEDLAVEFVWKTETPEWIEGTKIAQDDPHMIVGTSDGGAHLDRDDGAEAHTWFLQHWVREWGGFTLEEGVRQITAIPAALCGLHRPRPAARRLRRRRHDLRPRHRRPRPEGARPRLPERRRPRWTSKPAGRARHHRQRRADRASTASCRPTPASPARS